MTQTLKTHISGQGQRLVLLHGWGLNSGIFEPIAQRLSENYQVINIDLPGFGQNHHIELEQYSLQNITSLVANTLAQINDEVNAQPCCVIGWSLGGLVASDLALHYPHLVNALVTITSSPYFVEQPNWPGIKAELLTSFHQQLANDSQKTITNFLRIQAMGSATVRQDIKQIRQLIEQWPNASQQVLDQSLALLETVDLRSRLFDIQVPILRLYGRLDSLVPKAVIDQIDKLIPNSDSFTFQHASHAPFISHQDEFLQVLNGWINGNLAKLT